MNWDYKVKAEIKHKTGNIEVVTTSTKALDFNHVLTQLDKLFECDIHEDIEATEVNISITNL